MADSVEYNWRRGDFLLAERTSMADHSRLIRDRHPMSAEVAQALRESGLQADYDARPAYQQNDYLGWINSAKRSTTKQKRLNQMLEELRAGGVYMNMDHPPSRK